MNGSGAINFDGINEKVKVTTYPPMPNNNEFSCSMWVNLDAEGLPVHYNQRNNLLNFNGTNETGFVNDFSTFFSLTKNTMATKFKISSKR